GGGGDCKAFKKAENQGSGTASAAAAGRGTAAALWMPSVQATLRSLSAGGAGQDHANGSLAGMGATLNRVLCNSTRGADYVTFFYAQFDQTTQRLAYFNARHNPPLLFPPAPSHQFRNLPFRPFFFRADPSHDFRSLSSGGMFVGMFEHCGYEQEVVQMQPGDVLIAFTDGLPEAHNAQGEEFDEERIKETLAATAQLSVNEIRD